VQGDPRVASQPGDGPPGACAWPGCRPPRAAGGGDRGGRPGGGKARNSWWRCRSVQASVTRPVPPRGRRTAWWCRAGRSRSRPPPGVRVGREGSGRSAPARESTASRPRRPRPPSPVNAGTDQPHRGSWLPARGWRLGQGQLQHPIPQRLRQRRGRARPRQVRQAGQAVLGVAVARRRPNRSGGPGDQPPVTHPPRRRPHRPVLRLCGEPDAMIAISDALSWGAPVPGPRRRE
jgi:hypothetical protein